MGAGDESRSRAARQGLAPVVVGPQRHHLRGEPEHDYLREFVAEHEPLVSAVSYVEVLGCHRLTEVERQGFERFSAAAEMLGVTQSVLSNAVRLRQVRKMTFGDSLVAGTALAHDLTLVTRNDRDFEWIPDISVLNPFDER